MFAPSAGPAGLCAALLALGALSVPARSAPPQDVVPVRLTDEGVDPEVRALIDELAAKAAAAPNDPAAQTELGLACEANTLFALAEQCYRNVLALTPDQKQWAFRLGVMQSALGDIDGALESMGVAAAAFKNTPVIQARLGDLLLEVGRTDEAAAAFERAIAAEAQQAGSPKWAPSRVGLARARYDQGRTEEAVALLQEALALEPNYRQAHYTLGLCLMDLGREAEGELELKRGVNAWPQYPPDPHQPRLDAYAVGYNRRMMEIENQLNGGGVVQAEEALRAMLEARPDDHLALNMLAKALMAQGRMDEALAALRRSEAANPMAPATKIELTVALLNLLGPAQQQMMTLQQELQTGGLSPERAAEVQAQLDAANEAMQGLVNEALAAAQGAVQLAPNLGRARFYSGLAQYMTAGGDPQRAQAALAELELAVNLGCQEPDLYRYIGMAYAQGGRMKEMVQFAEQYASKQPDNPNAWMFLAQAYMTKDQYEPDKDIRQKAVGAIQRARAIVPNDPNLQAAEQAFRGEVERRNQAQAGQAGQGGPGGAPTPQPAPAQQAANPKKAPGAGGKKPGGQPGGQGAQKPGGGPQ